MKSNSSRPPKKYRNKVRKAGVGRSNHIQPITVVLVIVVAIGIIYMASDLGSDKRSPDRITESQLPGIETSADTTTYTATEEMTSNENAITETETAVTTADESEQTSETTRTPATSDAKNQDGVIKYDGFSDPRTIDPQPALELDQFTALVNKFYSLSSDYEPELVAVSGTPYYVHPSIIEPWLQLQADCTEATGIKIYLTSGYRSFSVQDYTFNDAIKRKGIALTVPYNALPGRSEHQLGLAVDVNDGVYKKYSISFSQTPTYAWLNQHAHEYGFILRYPKGKEHITDYAYEPWHYRYVGPEAAAEIHSRNIVLEEYHGV